MAKLENKYQASVVEKLQVMFPEATIKVNDGRQIQGFPDVEILHDSGKWAVLECKKSDDEPCQPNQEYYVEDLSKKGFAAFIYPENEKEILDELQRSLEPRRNTRSSKRKPVSLA